MKKVVSTEFSTKSTFYVAMRTCCDVKSVLGFAYLQTGYTRARGVVVDYYSAIIIIIIIINRMI